MYEEVTAADGEGPSTGKARGVMRGDDFVDGIECRVVWVGLCAMSAAADVVVDWIIDLMQ